MTFAELQTVMFEVVYCIDERPVGLKKTMTQTKEVICTQATYFLAKRLLVYHLNFDLQRNVSKYDGNLNKLLIPFGVVGLEIIFQP